MTQKIFRNITRVSCEPSSREKGYFDCTITRKRKEPYTLTARDVHVWEWNTEVEGWQFITNQPLITKDYTNVRIKKGGKGTLCIWEVDDDLNALDCFMKEKEWSASLSVEDFLQEFKEE